jgi:hypothetical protein
VRAHCRHPRAFRIGATIQQIAGDKLELARLRRAALTFAHENSWERLAGLLVQTASELKPEVSHRNVEKIAPGVSVVSQAVR